MIKRLKNNKKGVTLALLAQALALISLMFIITTMSVVMNVNMNFSKSNMLKIRAETTQYGYDFVHEHENTKKVLTSGFVGVYTVDYGWTETSSERVGTVTTYRLEKENVDYNIIASEDSNGKLSLEVTNKRGNRIFLILTMELNESDVYKLSSWQLKF